MQKQTWSPSTLSPLVVVLLLFAVLLVFLCSVQLGLQAMEVCQRAGPVPHVPVRPAVAAASTEFNSYAVRPSPSVWASDEMVSVGLVGDQDLFEGHHMLSPSAGARMTDSVAMQHMHHPGKTTAYHLADIAEMQYPMIATSNTAYYSMAGMNWDSELWQYESQPPTHSLSALRGLLNSPGQLLGQKSFEHYTERWGSRGFLQASIDLFVVARGILDCGNGILRIVMAK